MDSWFNNCKTSIQLWFSRTFRRRPIERGFDPIPPNHDPYDYICQEHLERYPWRVKQMLQLKQQIHLDLCFDPRYKKLNDDSKHRLVELIMVHNISPGDVGYVDNRRFNHEKFWLRGKL